MDFGSPLDFAFQPAQNWDTLGKKQLTGILSEHPARY